MLERARILQSLYGNPNYPDDALKTKKMREQFISPHKFELILRKGSIVELSNEPPINIYLQRYITPSGKKVIIHVDFLDFIPLEEEIETVSNRIIRVLKNKNPANVEYYIDSISFFDDLDYYFSLTDSEIRKDFKDFAQ